MLRLCPEGLHGENTVRNLVKHPDADTFCELELRRAGIDVVMLPAPQDDEVATRVTGKIGDVTLTRAHYYWRASGKVPADVARRLYADPVGRKDVRANGHCECLAPGERGADFEWFNADGQRVEIDPDGSGEAAYAHFVTRGWFKASDAPLFAKSTDGLTGYITSYDIDSAEGLALFACEVKAGSKGD